jgi:hypothetical protein
VLISALSLTQCRGKRWQQRARRAQANHVGGKAVLEIPALKPDRGKPAVRNFREGDGNSGIIEARQAPLPYPTPENTRKLVDGERVSAGPIVAGKRVTTVERRGPAVCNDSNKKGSKVE